MSNETIRDVGDAGAVLTAFASFLTYLPEVAALAALVWTLVRLYEYIRVVVFGKEARYF